VITPEQYPVSSGKLSIATLVPAPLPALTRKQLHRLAQPLWDVTVLESNLSRSLSLSPALGIGE
jgi:hypothetical protein